MIKRQIILQQLVVLVACLLLSNNIVLADHDHVIPNVLKSASEFDYPPFAIVRPDGTADGFSVALLKAVVEAADLEVNISVGSWNEIKQQLAEGRLDVLPLVGYTPERDKVYDFTVPYLRMHGAIFVRKGEKSIHSEADLKGKEVLVMRGDNSHEYAVDNNLTEKLILTTSFEEAMKLLSSGQHDAVFCQHLVGLQLIKKMGIKNIVSISTKDIDDIKPNVQKIPGFVQKFCLAVPEGRKELLAYLNEGLAIVIADGTYGMLYDKWFGPILPQPAVPLAKLIKSVLLILIPILLFITLGGIWYLKQEVRRKTKRLIMEIQERKLGEEALHRAHDQLEKKIQERTLELQKTHEQLIHAEKLSAIGGLSASIAHEFNNPLQGVMTVIKGVQRRATMAEEDAQLIDSAINECNRMRDLIKSLQDFNRPSSGRVAPTNIHATIDSLLLLTKKEHQTEGITVETNYGENIPHIMAVADQIKQVVLNLLNNAAYACEGGGTITISTAVVDKDQITLKIQDTGKGINPEHIDKIFEPFFTTKTSTKGTGLGLSISYGIIKKHGGRIDVESEPGKSTTFTISLPIAGVNNAK